MGGARTPRLNAPSGARCFPTCSKARRRQLAWKGLNAPSGARCFLTNNRERAGDHALDAGLNAPFGARCFLTELSNFHNTIELYGLNAPLGARRFLAVIEFEMTDWGQVTS